MKEKLKEAWVLIRETFQDWSEDKAPRLAAALAYYTVFSLAPLLVLVIAITGLVAGNNFDVRQDIITQVQSTMGEQAAVAVNEMIDATNTGGRGIIATVIGIGTLLLGATGLFGQLQDALNTIWEVAPKPNRGIMGMLKDRFLSFTMVLGVSFLLLVSLVISAMLSSVNGFVTDMLGGLTIVAQILNFIVSTGVIALIFAMIFKILPDVEIAWSDVWVGALVTALLFNIGKSLIGLYLANSSTASAYGAAGSLVILLLWVYYSAQILFLGAEFTQVYARRHGSKLVPSENARPLTENERAQAGMPRKREPLVNIQQGMIPVAGQPTIHTAPEEGATLFPNNPVPVERIRYEPRRPETVVPVIAAGTLAGAYSVGRMVNKLLVTPLKNRAAARAAERRSLIGRTKRTWLGRKFL